MPAKLLGVLSAYIPYRDVLISQQTQETKWYRPKIAD